MDECSDPQPETDVSRLLDQVRGGAPPYLNVTIWISWANETAKVRHYLTAYTQYAPTATGSITVESRCSPKTEWLLSLGRAIDWMPYPSRETL